MKIIKIFKVRFSEFYSENYSKLKIFFFQYELYIYFNEDKFVIKSSNAL